VAEKRLVRVLLTLLCAALAAAGVWLAFTVLLPWVLPFLLALGLAWLMEPAVKMLMGRFRLKRGLAAALTTAGLALLLCGALGLVLWRMGYELALLLGRLPVLLSGLPALGNQVEDWAYRFIVALPVQLQDFAKDALDGFIRQGISLPAKLYDVLAGIAAGAAAAVPDAMLFLFTTALAAYFTSAARPQVLSFLSRQMPASWRDRLGKAVPVLKTALGGWLRAQGLLMLVTFGELTVGFLILQVDLALLLAALVALVDALPVFGTGTVLLPWALFSLLSGDWKLALGLAVLYGLVSAVRSLLEPRLVGQKAGLPPLAALFAMYVGFRALGVWGMLLSPLAAIFLKQLHDSGVFRLWRDSP
jgi:sporulation integral membrane protein YtvI